MNKRILALLIVVMSLSMMWGASLISEGFATTSFPTGWSGDVYFNSTANHGTLTGANGAGFNANGKYLQMPSVNTAGTLTFWTKGSASASAISFRVLKSVGGGAFVTIADYPKPHNSTWTQRTVTVNDAGSNVVIKIESYDRTNNSIYLDDVILTDFVTGSPTITKSGSLTAFSTSQGTPSASQTYTISGANLTANILCVPPTGYEISTGSGYTTGTLTLTQSGGSVATTTIYARLTGATAGTPSGTITHNSTGATEVTVAVTGTVYKAEPSNHVTGFEAITADPPYSSVYMTWTDATGTTVPDGYLVKGSAISLGSIVDPVDGTAEANSALVQNIASGVHEATFYNLASNTTYYFKVFPYTNSGANINFKTDGTVTNTSVLTESGPPVAPVAISATAISHDGFTARWNTVSGATSYKLDVLSGAAAIATDLFISEYLEGSSSNKYIEIFNGTGATVDLSNYKLQLYANGALTPTNDVALTGTLDNGACVVYKNSAAALTLPDGVTATSNTAVNFNGNDAIALYKISPSSFVDIFGWIGDPEPTSQWGTSPLWTINTTLVRKSSVTGGVTTNPASGDFPTLATEWDYYAQDTTTYLGTHTMGSASTPVSGYENITVTGNLKRVEVLTASTDYSYRVRAYNTNGLSDNSNVIVLSTTATTPGVTANTTIGGASTAFTVPVVGAYTNLSVEIDPGTITSDDFTITVAEIPTGLTYTISTTNNPALNGVYLLNHAGMSGTPTLSCNNGDLQVNASEASGSIVTISGITDVKGDLIITAEDGGTLPVELSSFTATISTQNFVRLMWVTESETNVNGYYIYRGLTDDVSAALLVSDMISATNTSQQTSYMYLDKEIYEDGLYYYWLQNSDIDGSSEMHGPVTAQVTLNGGNTTPTVPLVTELQSVYPNPFNPSTFVRFAIATPAHVKIDIYNVRGQIVRSLVNADKAVGNHRIEWNGKDDNGSNCSNGIYYIRMNAGKDNFVRKAVMLK